MQLFCSGVAKSRQKVSSLSICEKRVCPRRTLAGIIPFYRVLSAHLTNKIPCDKERPVWCGSPTGTKGARYLSNETRINIGLSVRSPFLIMTLCSRNDPHLIKRNNRTLHSVQSKPRTVGQHKNQIRATGPRQGSVRPTKSFKDLGPACP